MTCGRYVLGRMSIERSIPPSGVDELATLAGFLDFQRATLAVKCQGLTDAQLRNQAVPPSTLSLLGLVRHLAEVEVNWFRPLLAGEPMGGIWAPGLDVDVAFNDVTAASAQEAFSRWHAECEYARQLVAAAPSLDVTGERGGKRYTLRWVLVHLIEEYSRHNGHADLLRERIDGSTGQ